MALDEVSRLCAKLNLDEDDGPIVRINREVYAGGRDRMDLCLVGKVLDNRTVNLEGLRRVLNLVWCILNPFTVEKMSAANVFLFTFTRSNDRQWVFTGGSWLFENQLISLIKPRGLGELNSFNFNLGSLLGVLEDFEIAGGNMRVRVRIDVTVPLSRGIRCLMEDLGKEVSILLRYEHLPDFCYFCGIIGHKARECSKCGDLVGGEDRAMWFRYGSWLRAYTPVVRNRYEYEINRPSPTAEGSIVLGEKMKQAPELSISSSSREHNYHGDEAPEVEEDMAAYGVDSVKQLQAAKVLEYNFMYSIEPIYVPSNRKFLTDEEREWVSRGAELILMSTDDGGGKNSASINGNDVGERDSTILPLVNAIDEDRVGSLDMQNEQARVDNISAAKVVTEGRVDLKRKSKVIQSEEGLGLSPKHSNFFQATSPSKTRKIKSPMKIVLNSETVGGKLGSKRKIFGDVKMEGMIEKKLRTNEEASPNVEMVESAEQTYQEL
ncbi:Zinc knuckle CX2CX4HX4C [Trema orientale]|uniref:Zinc knuckle CX2CX4HX4C n=1 Tax=Trema orientale TaxID=63057 RepID=A0A2P5C6J2_TREOI|nr:Zinc knuckle CX2CX4HX4C [Trema orientale]